MQSQTGPAARIGANTIPKKVDSSTSGNATTKWAYFDFFCSSQALAYFHETYTAW